MQSLQCWGRMAKAVAEKWLLLACLHLHRRHVIPCSRAVSHEQNICMCICIIHLNLNRSSYECERRLKPLCLHNFWVLVDTESKLKRKTRAEGRRGEKKRKKKKERGKKGVESAHNHVIYRQGKIQVVIWTVDLQYRKSPYWAQWSQVRCCLGLCERDENSRIPRSQRRSASTA